jgi:peptidoglycan/xylan/chitin deacetylase (PgdA/CDA1 family)
MKVIMYHYVREFSPKMPYFKYLNIENFKKQLDYFEDEYGFLSKPEFEEAIFNKTKSTPSKKIVLTFDDGLSDHYKYVYPELVRRGLWGIFYIPAKPYLEKIFLGVHLIHSLVGSIPVAKLLSQLESKLTEEMLIDSMRADFSNETYVNQKNSASIDKFKRILNYFIDYKYREGILSELISVNNIDVNVDSFYLSVNQIREMHDNGMIIGSHSVNHPVLSKLSYSEQKFEIFESLNFIELTLGQNIVRTFCFPYGGSRSYNKETLALLGDSGYDFSFSVDYRDVTKEDLLSNIQSLPRYDCNFFPHGEAS